jgi:septum formation protein
MVGGGVNEPLVLASTSPWRRRMLEAAGMRVESEPSSVDERALEERLPPGPAVERAAALASHLARAKASVVAARRPEAVVLGADQVGHDPADPARPFGKPSDPEDHLARLRALVGRPHELVTAWCLLGPGGAIEEGVVRSTLWVRSDLTDAELRAYVATGEGSGCAGGYAVEGHGAFLFERIDGDWNNVIGLPLFEVTSALRRRWGWRYGGAA